MAIVATISVLILILCLGMACLYRKHHVGASFMEQQSHFVQCNSLSPNAQINYPCKFFLFCSNLSSTVRTPSVPFFMLLWWVISKSFAFFKSMLKMHQFNWIKLQTHWNYKTRIVFCSLKSIIYHILSALWFQNTCKGWIKLT